LPAKDILIIGAGLAGIASAWALRQRGHRVTVFDAHDGPAEETSFANAGALTPSEPEPWNAPGVHWQLLSSLADPHSPMKLRLKALPGLTPWGLRFLWNSRRPRFEAACRANFALSHHSLKLTQAVRDSEDLSFDSLRRGTLKICRDAPPPAVRDGINKTLADMGLTSEILDVEETLAREPLLEAVRDQIKGSVFHPLDESGDARAFTRALAEAAEAAGVRFEWQTRVQELVDRAGRIVGVRTETEEIEVEAIVLATGHASWKLLAPHGLHLPVRPVKGYSLTLDMSGLNERPGLPVVDEALHTIATPMGDRLRIAGTAEFTGEDRTLREDRVDNLRNLLRSLYPQIAETLLAGDQKAWCGFRPMSADGRPFIGETRARGLWLVTGHGHLGWTQAMGSGDVLASLISDETPAIDATPFAATRI